ncbi:IPT/TIG domain-containing protein [Kitasatospora sp. NPDC101155]|uniref:IPT/TIG domain-containing protein n=1 Tax=Kitasatospora sp. NPDC101155 TaxID=3364097 RepID=UPI00381836DF
MPVCSTNRIPCEQPRSSSGGRPSFLSRCYRTGRSIRSPAAPWSPLPSRPRISGVSPSSGPEAGGTSVTLTGSGFTGATAVKQTSGRGRAAFSLRRPYGCFGNLDAALISMSCA